MKQSTCTRSSPLWLFAGVTSLLAVDPLPAQCVSSWLPGRGLAAVNGDVEALLTWDPDGAGPATPVVVVAGDFSIAGSALANDIATWDPVTGAWSSLGTGMDGEVRALARMANGDLAAGGQFTTAGGVIVNCVARWNGSAWSSFGAGMSGTAMNPAGVNALITLANGDLVAGGQFVSAGGVAANNAARWDGSSWMALGSGVGDPVDALALYQGDLVAGGRFTSAGGAPANNIVRWNGSSWAGLGSGMSDPLQSRVAALATLANGDLVAGGRFTTAGGIAANNIARWDGGTWSSFGSGASGAIFGSAVDSLVVLANGDLVAGGSFAAISGVSANNIARWDGNSWFPLGAGFGQAFGAALALASLPNGDLVAGGVVLSTDNNIQRWDGGSWQSLGSGTTTNAQVETLVTLASGDVVAGGSFSVVDGVVANNIIRWDGGSWLPLGSGADGRVHALTALSNADVVIGGEFTMAGGVSAARIARWSGTGWFPLGSGMDGAVHALTTLPNGDVVAGGLFGTAGGVSADHIARWDGSTWSAMGSGIDGAVYALTTLPNGDLIAGGAFFTAGGVVANGIARWNGTAWSPLGAGVSNYVLAVTPLPDGGVLVGGNFSMAGVVNASNVARWDGGNWHALGTGTDATVRSFTMLDNGNLVAGGAFVGAGGLVVNGIARWNGSAWSQLGSGMTFASPGAEGVKALATLANGDLMAGGDFLGAGDNVSVALARCNLSGCAGAKTYGTGCVAAFKSLHELLSAGGFDLAPGAAITLDRQPDGYVAVDNVSATLVPPSAAATVVADDDDIEETVALLSSMPIAGGTTSHLTICSNGRIALSSIGNGVDWTPDAANFLGFAEPTVAPAWHDYSPNQPGSGKITFEQSGGFAYVTWNDVFSYGTANPGDNFQVQFELATGDIVIVYQSISNQGNGYLAGYKAGGIAADRGGFDLSVDLAAGISVLDEDVRPLHLDAGVPLLGGSWHLTTTDLDPLSPIVVTFVGEAVVDPGVPLVAIGLDAPGCSLYIEDILGSLYGSIVGGTAVVSVAIPNDPVLGGMRLTAQSVCLTLRNDAQLLTSGGVDGTLGN